MSARFLFTPAQISLRSDFPQEKSKFTMSKDKQLLEPSEAIQTEFPHPPSPMACFSLAPKTLKYWDTTIDHSKGLQ